MQSFLFERKAIRHQSSEHPKAMQPPKRPLGKRHLSARRFELNGSLPFPITRNRATKKPETLSRAFCVLPVLHALKDSHHEVRGIFERLRIDILDDIVIRRIQCRIALGHAGNGYRLNALAHSD